MGAPCGWYVIRSKTIVPATAEHPTAAARALFFGGSGISGGLAKGVRSLIRDHELTLPPASYPWDHFDRRDEVWALERALADLRGERRRAVLLLWLRRALTLGIWWK